MGLQITGKNLDIGSALRTYVTDRIEQKLEKFVGSALTGHVRIEKERGQYRTDCSLRLKSGLKLETHGESYDAHASVDAALDRLAKRLRRYMRRLKKHHATSSLPISEMQVSNYVIEHQTNDNEEVTDSNQEPIIIAEKRSEIREFSVSDAVMQLDLSEESLFIFKNAGHGRINIVYRRDDGNIGWIDPDESPASAKPDS